MPRFAIPAGSPAGSLLKGFSYLYAPLSFPHVRHSVAGRLGMPSLVSMQSTPQPHRNESARRCSRWWISLARTSCHQEVGSEPVVNIFDQPRQ